MSDSDKMSVTRVQTGVRLEVRMLNVLKALAALKNMSLGDLLEGIVLHAFDGEVPFSEETLVQIRALKEVYLLDLRAQDSHRLFESQDVSQRASRPARSRRPAQSRRRVKK